MEYSDYPEFPCSNCSRDCCRDVAFQFCTPEQVEAFILHYAAKRMSDRLTIRPNTSWGTLITIDGYCQFIIRDGRCWFLASGQHELRPRDCTDLEPGTVTCSQRTNWEKGRNC